MHQRKLAIPPGFEWDYFSPGQGCYLFTYKCFKITTLICYDAEFSETVRHVAAQGADLVLVPTALGTDWDWAGEKMMPTRAFENGVFFAYANGVGTQDGITFLSKSVIVGRQEQNWHAQAMIQKFYTRLLICLWSQKHRRGCRI